LNCRKLEYRKRMDRE